MKIKWKIKLTCSVLESVAGQSEMEVRIYNKLLD